LSFDLTGHFSDAASPRDFAFVLAYPRRFCFLLNHTPRTQTVQLNKLQGIDLLTQTHRSEMLQLEALQTVVLEIE
jgi:hypothetical protein